MKQNKDVLEPILLNKCNPASTSTGFKFYNLKEGEVITSVYGNYNRLFFLLDGRIEVNSSESLDKIIEAGEFFFMPMSAEMSCQSLTECNFLLFYFNQLANVCDRIYFRELWNICSKRESQFSVLPIRQPISGFVNDIKTHFHRQLNDPDFQMVKYEELLYLLRILYSMDELAELFYPIAGQSLEFRKFIMENYLKVKNIEDLVKLSGLRRKTFDRQFNDEFGQPPYQWILKQKSKHIYYSLSETNEQMQEIMRKYGFTIAPHFTRLCKDYFNATPLELRKRLRIAKRHGSY